eukprot:CAMPEP_0182457966 /NCGR_PEP_ID=MMETSP1319-20130603/3413_1 /TAXON_ID=172717 /ORGANISM="Bolidomonas pacifica, Strain RCC208" /LENGTH=107 /DNA_ID=CAMNT_0024656543 /DNA_START=167 /DNA_END=486 /DNA_ORIENTATION=+
MHSSLPSTPSSPRPLTLSSYLTHPLTSPYVPSTPLHVLTLCHMSSPPNLDIRASDGDTVWRGQKRLDDARKGQDDMVIDCLMNQAGSDVAVHFTTSSSSSGSIRLRV